MNSEKKCMNRGKTEKPKNSKMELKKLSEKLREVSMKVKCPRCGSSNVCEILYGMPTSEAFELEEQGKIILGGCDIVMDDMPMPDYGCLDCKFEWAPELLSASDIIKIRLKLWTSEEISDELQKFTVFELFPNGTIRKYQYEGKSRKAIDKQVNHIEQLEMEELCVALQEKLHVPVLPSLCEKTGRSFNMQISYTDGRKIAIDSSDGMAECFLDLVNQVVRDIN